MALFTKIAKTANQNLGFNGVQKTQEGEYIFFKLSLSLSI